MGLLIVLAVVASVLMLFTDQISVLGSLAVIAALWAAVIAAILVTRYRRQAESAESKSRDLRLVYELQLEREIAARRQYELDVESTIRKEISDEAGVELAELKAQVLALRSSLEMLLGESLPDQRAALPNEKLRELASGLGGVGAQTDHAPTGYAGGSGYPGGYGATDYTAHDDGAVAARDFEQTAPGAEHRRRDSYPFDAPRRFGTDVDPNEMTEVLPIVPGDAPISGRIATEVPLDEIRAEGIRAEEIHAEEIHAEEVEAVDEPFNAETVAPTGISAEETGAEEVVVDVVDDQPRAPYSAGFAGAPVASGPTSAAPFSGGFYVSAAEAVGVPEQDSDAEPATREASDSAVEEAGSQEPASTGSSPEASGPEVFSPEGSGPEGSGTEGSGTEAAISEDSARAESAGRHETGDDGAPANSYGGGRRRREDEEDHDAAHTAGLPVAELLNQLRQSPRGSGGGRRRRED
ncbi:hypothetical protein GOACH_01_01770 [Gordonia aichiensis NBRC 108223]|uniref:DUF6779 domain-containing protein n=1 Tax=Gordonia aichiensis NBRC 108223 TaxID=1220583 RepID=L7KGL1_9ACTN|nr:hypothetical protein GOACH_01_01770 [Gordonia aichiensis NBRC 108223]